MGKGRVVIKKARLWICHVNFSTDIYNNTAKKLQNDTARHRYMKLEFICQSMNADCTFLRLNNLFQGCVPTQMVIVCVDTDTINGHLTKNKFNFKHHYLNERLETLPTILHTNGKKIFGVKKTGEKRINKGKCDRREVKIKKLRTELKQIESQWMRAPKKEQKGLAEIWDELRSQLTSPQRAEYNRKKRHRRARARTAFMKGSDKYVKRLLGNPRSGTLESKIW